MNDRMTELYASACLYARDQQLDLKDKNVPAFVECMAEKFAELVVEECIQTILKSTTLSDTRPKENYHVYNAAVVDALNGIQKHFGITNDLL